MGIIKKINAGGTDHLIASSAYGTCTTAANTAAKVVTLSNFDDLTNFVGSTIHVRFTNSNTAASPTLNVNSKGAKNIYAYGTTAPGTTAATSWQAGAVVSFTYNTDNNSNGCWVMNDYIADTDNDTKVTSSANHYTPSTASGNDKTASASGATAAWSIDVVKGITINTDGKGHITGLSVTSGKIPANPNSDTWRKVQLNGTDKLGTATSTNPLNLKAGTNMSITESSGTFTFAATDTNTTYSLSGALSSHKFTSTLTAGGSGSGTSTSDFTLAAGTGITITDDTSNRKMTIACSVTNTDEKVKATAAAASTTYYLVMGGNGGTAETKVYDDRLSFKCNSQIATLTVGDGTRDGEIKLYDLTSGNAATINNNQLSAERTISIPDKTGTIALTSDIPSAYSLPLAASGTRGGAQIGYSESGKNYAVKLSSEKMYVTVPWTDTSVTQTASTASSWYKILGSYNGGSGTTTTITSGTSAKVYFKNGDAPAIQPSTGTMYAPLYYMGLGTTETAYTLIQDLGWNSDVIV